MTPSLNTTGGLIFHISWDAVGFFGLHVLQMPADLSELGLQTL